MNIIKNSDPLNGSLNLSKAFKNLRSFPEYEMLKVCRKKNSFPLKMCCIDFNSIVNG